MFDPMEYDELIQGLAGDIPSADKEISIEEVLNRLKPIDIKQLSEREFFQEVLSVIKDINYADFDEKAFEKVSKTLKDIGCVDYKTWKAIKAEKGEKISEDADIRGIEYGNISTAERFVDAFLKDYSDAEHFLTKTREGSEEHGWIQMWLENNQKILDDEKDRKMIDKIIEKAVSESEEIENASLEKAKLEKEIVDTEKELEGLKAKKPNSLGEI